MRMDDWLRRYEEHQHEPQRAQKRQRYIKRELEFAAKRRAAQRNNQSRTDVFEKMIDASIVDQYDGLLERLDDPRDGGTYYRPLDTDHLANILVELWGDLLTPEAINEAFDRLMEEQDEWPHGYCDDEENRPLWTYDPD